MYNVSAIANFFMRQNILRAGFGYNETTILDDPQFVTLGSLTNKMEILDNPTFVQQFHTLVRDSKYFKFIFLLH
jgi:hypothetical protein